MRRVLLVNMPLGNLRWPNLGPSLLKGALGDRGIPCDVAYFNFDFAERVGLERYYWIADRFAFVLGGERLFAREYYRSRHAPRDGFPHAEREVYDDRLPDDERYWRDVLLAADEGLTDDDRRDYETMAEAVEPFLDDCIEAVDWGQYSIVGFATSFQQTMPSMCLARRLKRLRPETAIVTGGAACEGAMGVELLRQFPEVDYAFLGEADRTFPDVVEQLLAGGSIELPPGVVGRDSFFPRGEGLGVPSPPAPLPQAGEGSCVAPGRFMTRDLDALAYPDFDDYFARWEASVLREEIEPLLFFETSRGCWWGQKRHCKFCGLNGATLSYRRKTPNRAGNE